MRRTVAILTRLVVFLLSLILRIPYALGAVAGFLALFIVAFLEGFHAVYDGGHP